MLGEAPSVTWLDGGGPLQWVAEGDRGIATPPAFIENGDFEQGLTGWHVVAGKAFAKQPAGASSLGAKGVQINGKPLVPLGGNYWHTTYPIGHNGQRLIRVVTTVDGILESNVFSIAQRYLAFRLGGAGAGVTFELRIPEKIAKAKRLKALDAPDAARFVAIRTARPSGTDVLREYAWDLVGKASAGSLIGATAKIRLRVAPVKKGRQRLLVDHIRMLDKRPRPFHPPLWGWADIHCHPTAQAGFGNILAGHMHGPVEDLGSCLQLHGYHHDYLLKPAGMALDGGRHNDGSLPLAAWPEDTPLPDADKGFEGWPGFDEVTHIKTHQDWIKRAYDGGQRLMVALVVHNEMLASLSGAGQSDRDTVEPQVRMMHEFVAHNGAWCGLAATPADARALIEQNKLAFVLGLETDSINGWVKFSDFSEARSEPNRTAIHDRIHKYFEYLHKLGIVQINLIHLSDNAFGGMALYGLMFLLNSWQRTGRFPDRVDGFTGRPVADQICTPATVGAAVWKEVEAWISQIGLVPPPPAGVPTYGQGERNEKGLTVAGEVALLEAMRLGMVIDMDHMSEKGTETAFTFATTKVPEKYPLVSAHNGARAMAPRPPSTLPTPWDTPVDGQRMNQHTWPNESMKSNRQLDFIQATGGMFGHGIAGADSLTYIEGMTVNVANDCPGSSKTFAQGFQYVTRRLEDIPVALGTDWNALLPGPGPRFGPQAGGSLEGELHPIRATWNDAICDDRKTKADAQATGVVYDTPLRDWRSHRFPQTRLHDGTGVIGEGHFLWQALALRKTGVDLTRADVAEALTDAATGLAPAVEIAVGMDGTVSAAASEFNRAGVLWKNNAQPAPADGQHVADLLEELKNAVRLWEAMETGQAPAMRRSTAGPLRDYDYNLDGLSHYGMLPDMLQDLKNVKLPDDIFDKFFRSAGRYVEVWERSVAAAAKIPHP